MESKFQDALSAVSEDEIIDLEKRLVSIPSYTTQEAELAEFIADFLNDNGVEVGLQRVPFTNNKKSSADRSYNVIARIHGTGEGPSLMFNGHMDHDPIDGRAGDSLEKWSRAPFQPVVEDGFLYGKGCQDEKGGICAALIAAVTVRRLRLPLRGDLIVTPVCGHKTYSSGTRHLIQSGVRSDVAINTENSGNAIVPLHIGEMTARIEIEGTHPHLMVRKRFPALANQPTVFERVLRFLSTIGPEATGYPVDGWLSFEPHPILRDFPAHRVGKIESQGFQSKTIELWYYMPPGVTPERLKEDLEALITELAKSDPGFRARVETRAFGLSLETPQESPLVQTLARWHRQVSGQEPQIGAKARYAMYGDASILSQVGITSVVYGPGGGLTDLEYQWKVIQGEVPPDERIPIRDLIVAAKVCTLMAIDIAG